MDQSQSNYSFKCQQCGDEHELVLCFGIDKPSYYFSIPKDEVERRVVINDDLCIIDQSHYFIRGRLTIPVLDHSENIKGWHRSLELLSKVVIPRLNDLDINKMEENQW